MTRVSGNWLENVGTQAVLTLLEAAGHQAYFVGGCVRNALMGVAVSDIDIATDAQPVQVIALAEAAGLKAIPTGIEHGTVTVMSGVLAHEITTFRKDIETDGRRAVVTFASNMVDDARRRDFTMNAIYADRMGQVADPLGGLTDLENHLVRFIDDADARIKEDYLRSLRFFRFHAWYGDANVGLDRNALAAVAGNLDGLCKLSKERVGAEMLKLLAAPDPSPAVAAMEHAGVLGQIIPGATSRYLGPLVHLEDGDPPDPIRRLAAMGGAGIQDGLRLSRGAYKHLTVLRDILAHDVRSIVAGYRFGERAALDGELLRSAMLEQPTPDGFREQAGRGAAQVFPVKAADLMPNLSGKALGARLNELEDRWIHSNFELTRSQLLG